MSLKLTSEIKIKQNLKLSLKMQQSLNVLQMNSIDLAQYVKSALDTNIFLEANDYSNLDPIQNADQADQDLHDYDSINSNPIKSHDHSSSDFNDYYLSSQLQEISLKEYIKEQIDTEITTFKERAVAYSLLEYLDNKGYIQINIAEIADILKCSANLVKKTLSQLQTFEPPGIFARTLQECLQIQLRSKGLFNRIMQKIINNLDLLASGGDLAKICNITEDELYNGVRIIKSLNPKPSNGFFIEPTQFKIPDVIMGIDDNNHITLEIYNDITKKIYINSDYFNKVNATLTNTTNTDKTQDQQFLKQELNQAQNVIRNVKHRSHTLLMVAQYIVAEQKDFFLRGIMYLKPLTLGKVANALGMNESTISRTTSYKYLSTPSGIYEFKYFFSSHLENTRNLNTEVSSTKVKELIKQMILQEVSDKASIQILSDIAIAKELQKFGISVARRTIAKYRDSMNIGTASDRKKLYKLNNVLSNTRPIRPTK